MSHENLSRRAILAGAASVPALALPAVIATAIPAAATAAPTAATAPTAAAPDPVIALADRAIEAWDAHGDAIEALSPFEEAMFEWRRKNPRPFPLQYEAATEQAKAALRRWQRREKAAERRTGFTNAAANTTAALNASLEAMGALRDTVPQTFTGLAAKARAARHLKDDWADEVVASLGRDIGVMAGEVDREEVQS